MSDRFNQPFEITPSVREAVKRFEEYMIKKDPITYKHCKDVETKVRAFYMSMPKRFWAHMGVNRNEISDKIDELSIGALMHDAGKLFIDDSILKKEGPLDDKEFLAIQKHPQMGLDFLSEELLKSDIVKDSILFHHESFTGSRGYPTHVTGDTIPFAARVVAVADVHDALSAKRQYKDIIPQEKVAEMLKTDPKLDQRIVSMSVDLFTKMEMDNERVGNDISMDMQKVKKLENNSIFTMSLDNAIKNIGNRAPKSNNVVNRDDNNIDK
jgi:HD-GYP domain-containing protein (c-di-GMP phosphodiesterase class II)